MKLKIKFILSIALFASAFSSYGQSFINKKVSNPFSSGVRIDSIIYYLNGIPDAKKLYFYKPDSNIIEEITYLPDNNEWVFYNKSSYIFKMNIIEQIGTYESSKIFYNDNIKEIVHFFDNKIQRKEKFIYELDNLIEYLDIHYENDDTTTFIKRKYSYRNNEEIVISVLNVLDGIESGENIIKKGSSIIHTTYLINYDGTFLYSDKTEYKYDSLLTNFNFIDGLNSSSESFQYYWDHNLNDWRYYNRTKVFYSKHDLTNSIKPVSAPFVQIYPNPVVDRVNFKFEDSYTPFVFELSDLNGKNVITQKVAGNEQISLEALAKGVYIYRITNSNGEIKSGKLIKN